MGEEQMQKAEALETAINAEQKQRILGEKGLIALLALLSAFVPLSTDLYLPSLLMLEQQQRDTGSASSLIGWSGIFMGSIGMSVISLDWSSPIRALGVMYIITGLTSLTLWLLIANKPFVKQGRS
jgi:DHA1 family bicyclomycin/chloramphenicol resistance-like MFS transporter